MQKRLTILFLCCMVLLGTAFIRHLNAPLPKPTYWPFVVPDGWPKPIYDVELNPITKEGFELGKRLFYDGILSIDGNFPCASCHQQFGAFNNYEHDLSHGANNELTLRNAPALQNLAWQQHFMWDGSINQLDSQPFFPITAHNEMGETMPHVLEKLNKDSTYPALFFNAFGTSNITYALLGKALSQYLLSLVSSNSKYDLVMRGQASFNNSEQMGYEIFKQKCAACHKEPLFTDNSFRNIGMQPDNTLQDFGRMRHTKDSNDFMKFRVPSLRNVQVTFPYGHDGRFHKLFNVFNHYKEDLTNFPNTDPLVKNTIPISNFEAGRLTAFLHTLTDTGFLTNKKFVPTGMSISANLMHTH